MGDIDVLVDELLSYAQTLSAESHPKPTYSPDHVAAIRVPKGGSSCSKCVFVSDDKTECGNKHYIAWNNGSKKLLYPADEFCSDWYKEHPYLEAAGTSEGAEKGWDTRGRGRHEKPSYEMLKGIREMNGEDVKTLEAWRNMSNSLSYVSAPRQVKTSMRKAANVAQWIVDDWKDEQFGSRTDKPSKFFVVESLENGVIGAINIHPGSISQYDHISSLATRPDVISGKINEHGVGTRLMLQAARFAASHDKGIDLSALEGAEGFYRKLGMHEEPPTSRDRMSEFSWTPEEVKQMATGKVH